MGIWLVKGNEKMREDIEMFHNKFTGKYVKNIQVIPQLNAFNYRPGSIRVAYETWKELLGGEIGVAYYKDESIRQNEEMQEETEDLQTYYDGRGEQCRNAFAD